MLVFATLQRFGGGDIQKPGISLATPDGWHELIEDIEENAGLL
jgi:hypothetical protein